jgi:hypothetical protein
MPSVVDESVSSMLGGLVATFPQEERFHHSFSASLISNMLALDGI